ncbi:uncharacterized protein [Gossypium hirsutum]|uniref:Retrotransposon gag domain-containing protein n=1 Tax=Gossypium hirsutum TaxID=3635 RepID=A0A1U8IAB2_GOSHI|nr:uncharacterized protein LOC107894381 [Gossypium hirsutum]
MAEEERVRTRLSKELEDQCKWLEEKFRVMESADYHSGIDAKDLSLVPDLVLPPKFKTPDFEKYNGTSCPEAHITMFCRRMAGLLGSAAKWYNQLNHAQIHSWKDLAQAFMKQYDHVTDITPDRITLQNMEKKQNKSFRQYAQRWREVATQVQPPLLEKETTMLFINTLRTPFINHILGGATKSFSDIVMSGEMIENAIRCGKIEMGESAKKSAARKKENKVNNTSIHNKSYSKLVTCEYHAGISGHTIENCTAFKKVVERLIGMGVVKFDEPTGPNVTGNPLPSNSDNGVNAIIENGRRRTKMDVSEVKNPLKWVWKRMMERGLVTQDSRERPREARRYCKFHADEGHDIQECNKFRFIVQNLMDEKEMEFYEEIEG